MKKTKIAAEIFKALGRTNKMMLVVIKPKISGIAEYPRIEKV